MFKNCEFCFLLSSLGCANSFQFSKLLFQVGREEILLREWLDCYVTKGGLLVALQRRGRQPMAVKQMVDEWLDRYRQLAASQAGPASAQLGMTPHTFSSDGESDQE